MEINKLCLATNNPGKLREYMLLFKEEGLDVGLFPFKGDIPEDVERHQRFYENAISKALYVAKKSGLPSVADDSGLVVEALGGEPGVHSKRWMGIENDEERNAYLLRRMDGLEGKERRAFFICVISFVLPGGTGFFVEGRVEGIISREMRGKGGFGYDPVFFYPPLGKTFAEMEPEEKNRVSHRSIAFRKFVKALSAFRSIFP